MALFGVDPKEHERVTQDLAKKVDDIERLTRELREAEEAKTKLEQQLQGRQQMNEEKDRLLSRMRQENDTLMRERNEFARELSEIKQAKERTQELTRKLIIAQQDLKVFILKAKTQLVVTLALLNEALDAYPFLRYSGTGSDAPKNVWKQVNNQKHELFWGEHTEELHKELSSRQEVIDEGRELQNGVTLLVRLVRTLDEIAKLVTDGEGWSNIIKAKQAVLHDIETKYASVLAYDKSRHTPLLTVVAPFSKDVLDALREETLAEAHLQEINSKVHLLVRDLLVQASNAKKAFDRPQYAAFLPEYKKREQTIQANLARFFTIVQQYVDKNEGLVEALTKEEDEELQKAQEHFGIFIRNIRVEAAKALQNLASR